MNVAALEFTTCLAPIALRRSACSCLRTMFTRPMPSWRQSLFSICPRFDAAAVCTSAEWPSRRMVSTMPSAVSGFTKQEAPSAGVVPCGRTRHWFALTQRNCPYIAPPRIATVLPIRAGAWSEEPVRITTPAPSLPTGNDWPTRPAMVFIIAEGMLAVTTGSSGVPETLAVDRSAPPNSSPRSDGLTGDASTRINTSSISGSGTGTRASESSRTPSCLTVERNWSPVDCGGMGSPPSLVYIDDGGETMTAKQMKVPGPDHPITIQRNPSRVIVSVAGRVIADTREALTLREAAYPAVQYVPRKDVDMSLLKRTDHATYCPFKGDCAYYSISVGGERSVNAVWTYEAPYPSVDEIKDHLAFYPD